MCLGDLQYGLFSGMTVCLIPAAVQSASFTVKGGVAKSPALACNLEENDQVKNNFRSFSSHSYVCIYGY